MEPRNSQNRIPRHTHDGISSDKLTLDSIAQRTVPLYWTIPGAQAATATNYGVVWIADKTCVVTGFQEIHQTAGTDGSAVTLQLEKLTGTEAPGSGSELLSTALSLKATANTLQEADLVETITTRQLLAGDRLCLKDAGTLTSVANLTVLIFIRYP